MVRDPQGPRRDVTRRSGGLVRQARPLTRHPAHSDYALHPSSQRKLGSPAAEDPSFRWGDGALLGWCSFRWGDDIRPYPRNALAARAFISISAIVPPVTQLPPTHSTGLNASHSGALASVIPPVGQKRAW